MRRPTRILFSLPQNGGAHGAPARERRGVSGAPQATEPGCGAEPHVSWTVIRSGLSEEGECGMKRGQAGRSKWRTGAVVSAVVATSLLRVVPAQVPVQDQQPAGSAL